MDKLEQWLALQFEEKRVEPNSSLGKAIKYMTNHWEALTLFLQEAGAPLDNNICEQALKMAIISKRTTNPGPVPTARPRGESDCGTGIRGGATGAGWPRMTCHFGAENQAAGTAL